MAHCTGTKIIHIRIIRIIIVTIITRTRGAQYCRLRWRAPSSMLVQRKWIDRRRRPYTWITSIWIWRRWYLSRVKTFVKIKCIFCSRNVLEVGIICKVKFKDRKKLFMPCGADEKWFVRLCNSRIAREFWRFSCSHYYVFK